MRRFICMLIVMLLALPCALAEETSVNPAAAIIDQVMALGAGTPEFAENGSWMSVRLTDGQQTDGRVFSLETGDPIGWDDLFINGDEAEEALLLIAEDATYHNAYAENDDLAPMPRDSFTVQDGLLTVYYPADRLSHFSGRSGAFAFYAYELTGLLSEGVPLAPMDPETAADGLVTTLAEGTLPGPLSRFAIGGAMADVDAAWGVVDVPDLSYEHAMYHFEAAEARGATFLSDKSEEKVNTATIAGIMSRTVDFYGLCPGIADRAACVTALGEPDAAHTVTESDAYSRLPIGETLTWHGEKYILELHLVDGVLWSVAVLAA